MTHSRGAELEVRVGRVPLVLYAPHGGRRSRPVRRGDGVNDLYTDAIARELADALDAYAILNTSIDRNDCDLNRVADLASRARRTLEALRGAVDHARRDGAVPLVLLVHGWNVTMPACDFGVGLSANGGAVRGRYPTVSRETFEAFLEPLRADLVARGIEAPLGLRYAAASADNVTQLFSGRHREHHDADVAALAALACDGGVDGVQMELAIPLRWPGARRGCFVETLASHLGREIERRRRKVWRGSVPRDTRRDPGALPDDARADSAVAGGAIADDAVAGGAVTDGAVADRSAALRSARADWGERVPISRSASGRRHMPPGWSLQAVLDDGGGLFAGAEPTSEAEAAARLCLVLRDGTLVLFVGEDAWDGDEHAFAVGGLRLTTVAAGEPAASVTTLHLRYTGPLVVYPSHDAFCDLELGLAGARLIEGEAVLVFEPRGAVGGRLRGRLLYGTQLLEVDVPAVLERGSRRNRKPAQPSRVFVAPGPAAETWRAEDCECASDGDGGLSIICRRLDGEAAAARILTRVPVYRPLGGELMVKVTFGTFELPSLVPRAPSLAPPARSLALFEHVEIVSER